MEIITWEEANLFPRKFCDCSIYFIPNKKVKKCTFNSIGLSVHDYKASARFIFCDALLTL